MKDPNYMLTPNEVAVMLNVKPGALAKWRHDGTGPPCYQVGDGPNPRIRYRAHELEEWLAAQRVEPNNA